MKKLILSASLVAMAMLSSCERELLVPEGTKPEWLGESIYEELRKGTHLEGTFNTYLRLVDDLEYAEVLAKTGSKTVFPANDEAFERFFQNGNNPYGATCYEDLSEAMKKQILYSSMLDNALLAGMLSNVKQDDNNVSRGRAVKHETSASVIDSITHIVTPDGMPKNNLHWKGYNSIHVVSDATRPMMVHFTREQMLANNITTTGTDSDFGILRGEPVGASIDNSETAYIYQTKVLKQDITCLNGYIHQVEDVLVPPGNVAQVLRNEKNTKLISRIVDYHSAPYYDATTTANYNSWAMQYGQPIIDSIFQIRYFSSRSQGGVPNILAPSGVAIANSNRLEWDLGWNQYYSSTDAANYLDDMGAILVPTDEAIESYFLPGGEGDFFIELYGAEGLENTKENLPANLDALYNKGNGILTTFVNNMIQTSFVATVPSKFGTITNDGSGDFMGLTKDDIQVTADGKYDVKVANNGVIYKMKQLYAPDEFRSVIGPAIIYPDLSIMGYFSQDKTSGANAAIFGADMYYYLMAMKSNYLYFIPSNESLKKCFIDPVSLGTSTPRAMEFYTYIDTTGRAPKTAYGAKLHPFNPTTGEINLDSIYETVLDIAKLEANATKSPYASQVSDMLNYNTVVLDAGEQIINNYYLTKHGGAIKIDDFVDNGNDSYSGTIYGGAQIDNGVEPAKIVRGWKQANGWAFQIDGLIQPCITSINQVLTANSERFQMFLDLCNIFENKVLMAWAGISSTAMEEGQMAPIDRYTVFSGKEGRALDNNVNFLNGYNYTLYAPDNAAMLIAHEQMGLPTHEQINAIYEEATSEDATSEQEAAGKAKAKKMIDAVRAFVRYHFQNNSVFADNHVKETTYQSLYSSDLGIPVNITSKSSGGVLTVTDAANQHIVIDANDANGRIVNRMARDYEYDQDKKTATSIAVSSFAVMHQVSTPLCYSKSKRFDDAWR